MLLVFGCDVEVIISGFYILRVDAIDPALRRSGRFDAEIEVTTPNEEERFQILKVRIKFTCLRWCCYLFDELGDTLK